MTSSEHSSESRHETFEAFAEDFRAFKRSVGLNSTNIDAKIPEEMLKRLSEIEQIQEIRAPFFDRLQIAIDELVNKMQFELELDMDLLNEPKISTLQLRTENFITPSPLVQDKVVPEEQSPINPEPTPFVVTNENIRKSKRKPKPKLFADEVVSTGSPQREKKKNRNLYQSDIVAAPDSSTDEGCVTLGPNGTKISSKDFASINWDAPTTATRKLLSIVFTDRVMATHSLTGRPSPAFYGRERPMKDQLNPEMVADIVHIVLSKTDAVEREIRAAITTKCADSTKMFKMKLLKQQRFSV